MKRLFLCAGLALCLVPLGIAQDNDAASSQSGANSGQTENQEQNNANIDAKTIREAQTALQKRGYQISQVDGVLGSETQDAIRQFQVKEGLQQTGTLDSATLSRLKITPSVSSAASGVASGTKQAGSEIKQGNPVEAGKQVGQSSATMGKSVGKKAESMVNTADDKVQKGMDVLSEAVYGQDADSAKAKKKNKKTPEQSNKQGQAVGQPESSTPNETPQSNNPK